MRRSLLQSDATVRLRLMPFLSGGSIIALHQALDVCDPPTHPAHRLVMVRIDICDVCDREAPCNLINAYARSINYGWCVCAACRWKVEYARSCLLRENAAFIDYHPTSNTTDGAPTPITFFRARIGSCQRGFLVAQHNICGQFVPSPQHKSAAATESVKSVPTLFTVFHHSRTAAFAPTSTRECNLQRAVSIENLARHNRTTMLPRLRALCRGIRADHAVDPITARQWTRRLCRHYMAGIAFLVAAPGLSLHLPSDAIHVVESFLCTYLI